MAGQLFHAHLPGRGVLRLSGEAARGFLQGLLTSDLDALAPGRSVFAGLLSPQGKLLADMIVHEAGDGVLIEAGVSLMPDLEKRLTLYRLRAKVAIENLSDTQGVHAIWGDGAAVPEGPTAAPDPRLPALGIRVIAPRDAALPGVRADASAYRAHRIALGVPDLAEDGAPDTMFALDLNMDELHGVSFRKGCYVGQEVTARMKHRGSARRRVLLLAAEGAPPPRGTDVKADGRTLGEILGAEGGHALALMRLDRLAEAGGAALVAGDTPVRLAPMAYAVAGLTAAA